MQLMAQMTELIGNCTPIIMERITLAKKFLQKLM